MRLKKGDKAPNFDLVSDTKENVRLQDFPGKNKLILFFPFAFTSICTTEMSTVKNAMQEYEDLNTEVIAISVDSPFTLAKFRDEFRLNFHLLSDFNKEACRAYGSCYETYAYDMQGVAKRSAFVVDTSGKIAYEEVLEDASLQPDFKEIKSVLKSLQETILKEK